MGMFAHVRIDESVDLPHFPEELDHTNYDWQSKRGVDVFSGPYRLTRDGGIEQQTTVYRDKTDEEKQEEAERWGFGSWDEYTAAYDPENWDIDEEGVVPDAVDWDGDAESYDERPPSVEGPSEKVVPERLWVGYNKHGTIEFHATITEGSLDIFIGYEARFNRGELEDIMFLGCRHCNSDDPVEHALQQIEDWQKSETDE